MTPSLTKFLENFVSVIYESAFLFLYIKLMGVVLVTKIIGFNSKTHHLCMFLFACCFQSRIPHMSENLVLNVSV